MRFAMSEFTTRSMMTLGAILIVAAFIAIFPDIAIAADDDWVKEGTSLIDTLRSGLVTIGALVVGIGVIVVGIWAAATGRLDWLRLAMTILGGILIMSGPAMAAALLERAQG